MTAFWFNGGPNPVVTMGYSTSASFSAVNSLWCLNIPYLCYCHWCSLALPKLMTLLMQPHVMCVYKISDPHLLSWPPNYWASCICRMAVITVRMSVWSGDVLNFSFTCRRSASGSQSRSTFVSWQCEIVNWCDEDREMALSLIAAAAVMTTPLSPCPGCTYSIRYHHLINCWWRFHLLAVAFPIHVDTVLFLGVGLSNFGMVVHGSCSFLFCSLLHHTLVISFHYVLIYGAL